MTRAYAPLSKPAGDLEGVREALYAIMWDDVGILRDAAGLLRARAKLAALRTDIAAMGARVIDRRYNLAWTDRLNLENMIVVSEAICAAALARTDSRGAHFREDFPTASDLATSRYTVARMKDGDIAVTTDPVIFTRVKPGETLLEQAA